MPLVNISLAKGKPESHRKAIADSVYDAMTAELNVPADDRFILIHEFEPSNFDINRTYLGIARTDDCVIIQVTLNAGRSTELKKAFYATLAEHIHERTGLRKEDVFINLVEVVKENWSFGLGLAQYA